MRFSTPVQLIFVWCCIWITPPLQSQEKPADGEGEKPADPTAFRTDDNPDEKLPWFQLVDGEFPPENSAHHISGELIHVEHLKRRFALRADRTDSQNRSHFDLPLMAGMLPYGSIYYHGAPAALEDIPLGTHLHGHFFLKKAGQEIEPLISFHGRVTPEADFTRCFRLEDDFSYYHREGQIWHIDDLKLTEKKLTATLQQGGKAIGDPKIFDLIDSTRVWKGRGFETVEQLAKGQQVQMNITWATLYGPGRITDIWIDEPSRNFAIAHQTRKHRHHIRQRGIPGRIDAVDNKERIVTITFFDSVDPKLFDELRKGEQAGVAVAANSLKTYDPVNDRKRGPVIEKTEMPAQPGASSVQIQVQPDLLLEGYRPKRIVRVFSSSWPVIALPREEELFGQEPTSPD